MSQKRLLGFSASDSLSVRPMEIRQAILASEERTVMAEDVASSSGLLAGVTGAELEWAVSADLTLFNALDLFDPQIVGIPDNIEESPVEWIKKAIGRPIGVNLEPVDIKASTNEAKSEISIGKIVSPRTLKQANKLGFNFVCLTGNPGTGVTSDAIEHVIELSREHFDGLIIAGKMYDAKVDEPVTSLKITKQFVETDTDMLLVPAPYTVPYFMERDLKEIAGYVRSHNKGKSIKDKVLLLTTDGTSQDSSDSNTIRKIALTPKTYGANIQHTRDSLNGICLPEDIFALGQAIRGYRHQMVMLGKSNLR